MQSSEKDQPSQFSDAKPPTSRFSKIHDQRLSATHHFGEARGTMKTSSVLATVVGAIGFAVFTALLLARNLGVLAYVSLLGLLVVTCVVIPVLERLKTLDVKNLKLTLDKIESVKKEIYAKESDLRRTSLLLAELIAANATVSGIWGDEESKKYSDALVRAKIGHLAQQLRLTSGDLKEIFKYEKALAHMQEATGEERTRRWRDFIALMKQEAESPP